MFFGLLGGVMVLKNSVSMDMVFKQIIAICFFDFSFATVFFIQRDFLKWDYCVLLH